MHDVVHRQRLDDVLERAVLQVLQLQLCPHNNNNNIPSIIVFSSITHSRLEPELAQVIKPTLCRQYSLSARRYTDFALGGRGRSGLLRSQSAIQSLRERAANASADDAEAENDDCDCCCPPPTRANAGGGWFSAAAGVETTATDPNAAPDGAGGGEAPRNVEESGAKVIVSV